MTASLDPQVRRLIDEMDAVGVPPSAALSVAGARGRVEAFPEFFVGDGDPEPVADVREVALDGPGGDLPVRLYRPDADGPLPALVYYHGGGWVLGNLEARDDVCRALANAAGCLVANVDYRLAPEHPFPAPVEDAVAAATWVVERAGVLGVDPDRVAVGGDSAGGNLAAATALAARERGGPALACQLLVYPVLDHAFDTPSYEANAEGYFLTAENMRWYWDHYLRSDLDGLHPLASPLRATDLSGLPPAHVVTVERDPLRDEGRAYAERLDAAGVPTTHVEYEDVVHGFLTFFHRLDRSREIVVDLAAAFRDVV